MPGGSPVDGYGRKPEEVQGDSWNPHTVLNITPGGVVSAPGSGEVYQDGRVAWAPGPGVGPLSIQTVAIPVGGTKFTRFVPPRDMTIRCICTGRPGGVANPAAGHTGAYAIYDGNGNLITSDSKLNLWGPNGTTPQIGFINLTNPYDAEQGVPIYIAARTTVGCSPMGFSFGAHGFMQSMMLQVTPPFTPATSPPVVNADRWEVPHVISLESVGGGPAAPDFASTIRGAGAPPSNNNNVDAFTTGILFWLREDELVGDGGSLPNG